MRIVFIAAGAGGSYCGACSHDAALIRGLTARGHEVDLIPLYTPLLTDRKLPDAPKVFFGGLNVYLQQRWGVFRHTPALIDDLFDSRWLLGFMSKFAIETRPEDLGEMTVSVLAGRAGRQQKELAKLIRHLKSVPRFDVVHLTNSLLAGLAPALAESFPVPIVSSLQGEEQFVQRLGPPWRDEALALIRKASQAVSAFLCPSDEYAKEMTRFLAVDASHIRLVRPGIDLPAFAPSAARPRESFRIGFLSRVSPAKGLDILCDAFIALEREKPRAASLAVAGQVLGANRKFFKELRARLESAGVIDRFEYAGAPDFEGKLDFLSRCSVLVIPSRYPERLGMPCLEAMAAGVPIVVPERGVFTELVRLTGGGVLVKPDDVDALVREIAQIRDDPQRLKQLAGSALSGMQKYFSRDLMVDSTVAVYESLART
jgi:glycosyltransferase involved in cell wall biosynthesis